MSARASRSALDKSSDVRGNAVTGNTKLRQDVIRMTLTGATLKPELIGLEQVSGSSNYFIGNEPDRWHTNIPHFSKVHYKGVYEGIDVAFYGNNRQLEYDFLISPGRDPNAIGMNFQGATTIRMDDVTGDLILNTDGGTVRMLKPLTYQELGGVKKEIPSRYEIKDGGAVGFKVEAYDRDQVLIIDPVLAYSTYLGGSGHDFGYDIAVDSLGNAYVVGQTNSVNFPAGASRPDYAGEDFEGFVTKLNAGGTGLIYSTYIGGGAMDFCQGVALDEAGNAYVTGRTQSTNFPVTPGSFQFGSGGGGGDAFVVKINETGSALVYSTYLGGGGYDDGSSIALDVNGRAYITGLAGANFPTTAGAFAATNGGNCAFVAKLNEFGSGLSYSTYLPETNYGYGIAVDPSGHAHVAGGIFSDTLPTTLGAFQPTHRGGGDGFLVKLGVTGSNLVFSTYLGGSDFDRLFDVALDSNGNAYVTGETFSLNLPTSSEAFQTTSGGFADGFLTKFNPNGSAVVYSSYLGGSDYDRGQHIAVDSNGSAYVTGTTLSSNFPVVNSFQATLGGSDDAYVTKVNEVGSALVYSSYYGGTSGEGGYSIAVDSAGDPYVIGYTGSNNLPLVTPFQSTFRGGGLDVFVTKIRNATQPVFSNLSSAIVIYGTNSVSLGGNISAGSQPVSGSVSVTLNGVTQAAPIQQDGSFSTSFEVGHLPPTTPAYGIFYQYEGNTIFTSAAGAGTLTITYQICVLYDQSKAVKRGSTIPIKLYPCDANSANASTDSLIVAALRVLIASNNAPGTLDDSGNANPDNNFRYDSSLGISGGYIFNLSTRHFETGTYNLYFRVTGDPIEHSVEFQVK
ncbi:MAG TPA: SBBP repeat-containing protein [Pyrinomonadaceae bacterium]|nr:SBBP repeat-containing protein [Pyrinomonadaceae bacterium]